ncbi:hypothetical protein ORI20_06475 [Mycobacterium sp. CVI_P3]|uniref:Secreted protein n=1 Tax=Mycobacterium pinniadriaticum TaxID=2994102 RepID=A0ABT3SC22_9MYCO|nr:hypothetical protein [Mycobacterium pinniadriaticum]MCX2929909.1 hypothetical protein [Mycobacterium pinniadriaticum]MCX2936442.1 hypothetical protein [Mycobacterium pinniadriaticum]
MMAALLAFCAATALGGSAGADPAGDYDPVASYDRPKPLPIVTPVSDDWQPMFPFPFDELRRYVTDADIQAEREMCQWFTAQYNDLRYQIEGLNDSLIRNNGHYDADGVQQQADIVTANIDQSAAFLAPRAQALTQSYDHAGDMYFPIYQGDSFYGLWQQMSNVSAGIRGRQPTWFTGPSYLRMLHWGSKINRSHVCR